MPLYWLCYRHNNQIRVVIEPGASLIHARMSAGLGGIDQSEFTEGHALPSEWQVPKAMIGRRLSQDEAKRLLCQIQVSPLNGVAAVPMFDRYWRRSGHWAGVAVMSIGNPERTFLSK
jgi:hypothetical protein